MIKKYRLVFQILLRGFYYSLFLVCSVANGADTNSKEVIPQPEFGKAAAGFLRSRIVDGSNTESQFLARSFSPFQALPLAWFDLHDNAYCIRLSHVHALSSAPTSRGIVIEFRGYKGSDALVLAEIDQVGTKWTAKIVPAKLANKLLAMLDEAHLFEGSPLMRPDPRFFGAYVFVLEIRHGRKYNLIRCESPSVDTDIRGLTEFSHIVQSLIEIAEVPPSDVFYGDSKPVTQATPKTRPSEQKVDR